MEDIFVRSSRMPLAMLCPPSIAPAPYQLNEDSDPARLGTAVHEWLGPKIDGSATGISDERFELLAVKYTLPVDEIKILALRAWELWGTVRKYFPQPEVEVEVASDALKPIRKKGHIDVRYYSSASRTIYIYDHKTGWIDADCTHQIKDYGFLSLGDFPEADRVKTLVGRTREFTTDGDTYSREELTEWAQYSRKRLTEGRDDFNPGRHCTYCSHRLNCQAYQDWSRRSLQLLLSFDAATAVAPDAPITPKMIGDVYSAKSSLDKLLKSVQEVLKTMAEANRGSIDCGDAYELRLEDEARTEILFSNGYPVLKNAVDLSPDEWDEIIDIGKSKLSKKVMDAAAHGQKKQAWAELMERLTHAQATREKTVRKLLHRKKSLPMVET